MTIKQKFYWISICLTAGCAEVKDLDRGLENSPLIRRAENQNYCYGTPFIEIIYPRVFNDSNHRATLVRVEVDGAVILETELARFDSIGGSYICLDKELLEAAQIAITYGEGESPCQGYSYSFELDGLLPILETEEIPLQLARSATACE